MVLRLVPRSKATTARDHTELARLVMAREFDAAAKALHAHIDLPAKALQELPQTALNAAFALLPAGALRR